MYEWFIFSVIWLGIWLFLYMTKPKLRKEMLILSLLTLLVGFTEPIFVPAYWSPQSLFDLNIRTGFDIESLIFCFAVGGIGSILYESMIGYEHIKRRKELDKNILMHIFSLLSFPITFLIFLTSGINPIYSLVLSMLIGGLAAIACRPDLAKFSLIGGFLFTILYFIFFLFINIVSPDFINSWNLSALSGIVLFGIPIEELAFAFSFGMICTGFYEHIMRYEFKRK
jgi:hypothetical protein